MSVVSTPISSLNDVPPPCRRDPPPRKSYLDGHPGKQIIVHQQQQQQEQRDATKRPSLPSPSLEAAKTTFEPLHILNRHGSNLNNFTADVDEMDFDTMIKQINDHPKTEPCQDQLQDSKDDNNPSRRNYECQDDCDRVQQKIHPKTEPCQDQLQDQLQDSKDDNNPSRVYYLPSQPTSFRIF